MNRVYTRTGDEGMTSIHGHVRVPKTDIRIEATGTLDELNVEIGNIRTTLPMHHEWQTLLKDIQFNLMPLMSIVSTRSDMREGNPNRLDDSLVSDIENMIDKINSQCTSPDCFILPGGTPLASLMHKARVTARRAERRLWQLNETDSVPSEILQYVNRLSDLFFVMARHTLQSSETPEEIWKDFGYYRKMK